MRTLNTFRLPTMKRNLQVISKMSDSQVCSLESEIPYGCRVTLQVVDT